jgi:precorrin-3B synthase
VNIARRNACPSITEPMPTGDGLLARIHSTGPVLIKDLLGLCDAALEHGNGVLEVTQRGSLQIRGLTPASAPGFARAVFAEGGRAQLTPPILPSPLMGFDVHEAMDLRETLNELQLGLALYADQKKLGPKVSILLDGSGALHLDDISGDLRLRALSSSQLHMSIADANGAAIALGAIDLRHALEASSLVLDAIAARGPLGRARDLANAEDLATLRVSLVHLITQSPHEESQRSPAQPVGRHQLKDGTEALGVALLFGNCHASTLRTLASAAAQYGASAIEPAPGRALLIVGLQTDRAQQLAALAAQLGFIVEAHDPRRFVFACAGAPACGSALMAAREAAPEFARAAATLLDGSIHIHLSGCPKGCAHPGAAAMTFVGPGHFVAQGRAGDVSHTAVSIEQALAGLARLSAERARISGRELSSAQMLTALGASGMLAAMDGAS